MENENPPKTLELQVMELSRALELQTNENKKLSSKIQSLKDVISVKNSLLEYKDEIISNERESKKLLENDTHYSIVYSFENTVYIKLLKASKRSFMRKKNKLMKIFMPYIEDERVEIIEEFQLSTLNASHFNQKISALSDKDLNEEALSVMSESLLESTGIAHKPSLDEMSYNYAMSSFPDYNSNLEYVNEDVTDFFQDIINKIEHRNRIDYDIVNRERSDDESSDDESDDDGTINESFIVATPII